MASTAGKVGANQGANFLERHRRGVGRNGARRAMSGRDVTLELI